MESNFNVFQTNMCFRYMASLLEEPDNPDSRLSFIRWWVCKGLKIGD